jgi:hypothetical protein
MSAAQDQLLIEAEEMLVKQTPPLVQSIGIREPVYCLRIWYYGSDVVDDRVPDVMLPKESVRAHALAHRGETAPTYIWGADELLDNDLSYRARFQDRTLCSLFDRWFKLIDRELPEGPDELLPLQKMTQRIATRLNGLDWKQYAKVTDDFIVFAADGSHNYCDDYAEMVASVPAQTIALLRSQRMLGTDPWWKLD